MFKEKIEQIANEISGNPDICTEYLTINDLLDMQFDDYIIQFIQSEIECWIYEDRLLRQANKSFDFSGLDNDLVNNEVDNIYKKHVKISAIELKKLILNAVKLRANYLIKPKNCLIAFCFMNSTTSSQKELDLKLSYFIDYHYLINDLKLWLSTINLSTKILRFQFEQKITEIENANIQLLDGYGFFELIEVLWMFFENQNNEIHSELLKLFFEDKNILELATKIKIFSESKNKNYISKNELQNFFAEIKTTVKNSKEQEYETIEKENITSNFAKSNSDFVNIENPEALIEDIRFALNKLAFNTDTSEKNDLEKIEKVTLDKEETFVINQEVKVSVDVKKILEEDDDALLSADDIDALFNQ